MEKALISGANGFIASNLIPRLEEKGYDVYSIDRYVTGRYLQSKDHNTKVIEGNINDHDRVRDIIVELQPEYVAHLAAISPVQYSYEHPFEVIDTNFRATVNLAEVCRKYDPKLRQFLFAGTSEEYGNQDEFPINESAELRPNSPYAVSKVASDNYLKYMRDAYNFPITVLRPFNTYGRTVNMNLVTERIMSQMLRGDIVNLGDPTAVRDFIYVDDHAEAYLHCIGNEKAVGETFNFCTGIGISIRELAEAIAKITGYRGTVNWGTIPPRPLDIKTLIGNRWKAYETLGWSPRMGLRDGLEKTVKRLKEQCRMLEQNL